MNSAGTAPAGGRSRNALPRWRASPRNSSSRTWPGARAAGGASLKMAAGAPERMASASAYTSRASANSG